MYTQLCILRMVAPTSVAMTIAAEKRSPPTVRTARVVRAKTSHGIYPWPELGEGWLGLPKQFMIGSNGDPSTSA